MIHVVHDKLRLDGTKYEIVDCLGQGMFDPAQIRLEPVSWDGCPRGFQTEYAVTRDRLMLRGLRVGYEASSLPGLRTFTPDPLTATNLHISLLGPAEADLEGGIARWRGLRRRVHFSGTMFVSCCADVLDYGVTSIRLVSDSEPEYRELEFVNGYLRVNRACEAARSRALRSPPQQLLNAVRDAVDGTSLLEGLVRLVLPRNWGRETVAAARRLVHGSFDGQTVPELLALLVDTKRLDHEYDHPVILLQSVLETLRDGPMTASRWTSVHQRLHHLYQESPVLIELAEAISVADPAVFPDSGVCKFRGSMPACVRDCEPRKTLARYRKAGSTVLGASVVRFTLGFVPPDCECSRLQNIQAS
jgi:hypothetical protein